MGEKLITMISVVFVSFLLLITVSLVSSSYQTRVTMGVVDDFVNEVMYNGYFSEESYYSMLGKIPMRNITVNITRYMYEEEGEWDESAEALSILFTEGILQGTDDRYLNKRGEFLENSYMQVGDIFKVDVIQLGNTDFEVVLSSLTGKGKIPFRMIVSRHVVIANTKYERVRVADREVYYDSEDSED